MRIRNRALANRAWQKKESAESDSELLLDENAGFRRRPRRVDEPSELPSVEGWTPSIWFEVEVCREPGYAEKNFVH
ncbi:MAG: hypothetical protein AAFV88_07925, partial [Planctomycetota bacterium]